MMATLYWPDKLDSKQKDGEVYLATRGVLTEVLIKIQDFNFVFPCIIV